MRYLLWLLPILSWAQATNIRIKGVTATRVIVEYTPPSAADCSVTGTQGGSAIADTNELLFSGSSSDASRKIEDTGRRQFVLGKRITEVVNGRLVSRALRADTDGVVTVTCGSPVSIPFRTARISGMPLPYSGFNADGHGNWGLADFDWTDRNVPVIDHLTGAAIYRATDPQDAGFKVNKSFDARFGGSGWTSPDNALSGTIGTLATTSNTNYIALTVDTIGATIYGGFSTGDGWPRLSALAFRIFGSGADATDTNRQVWVCLSIDSGQTCYTDPILITLPQTTAAEVGTAGVGFPTSFPTANFTGWSKSIPPEYWTHSGYVTVSGSTVTLTRNRDNEAISFVSNKVSGAYFKPQWVAGTRIHIAGSSAFCPGSVCTIASVQSRTSLTIEESGTVASDAVYKLAALAVRIAKTNATNSVSLSASARLAAYLPHHTGSAEMCSPLTVQTTVDRTGAALGRTITGRLCTINKARNAAGRLYFIGESEPEFRLVAMVVPPASIAGHTTPELPSGAGFLPTPSSFWSETNANTMYIRLQTQGGTPSVFSMVYSGDYRENSTALWSYSQIGLVSSTEPLTWNNILKGSLDPATQIRAHTTYNETRWPSLSNLQFGGFVGSKFFFYNLLSGQDLPCAVFTFDTASGAFERWFDTLGNGIGGTKFGGCHSLSTYGNRITISTHTLVSSNSSTRYGGPFIAPVTHVIRSGSPSTTITLPEWTDGSYDSACPSDIAQLYKNMGAIGNECVTLRFGGEPCSATPETSELGWTPCPWDAARSWIGKPVEPGDSFQDYPKSINPGTDIDSEHMLVVKRTELTGGAFELVLLRDSATGYACQLERPRGRSCVAVRNQAQHASGWAAFFKPISATLLYDPQTGEIDVENDEVTRGHFNIVTRPGAAYSFLGLSSTSYAARLNATSFIGWPVTSLSYNAPFAGVSNDSTWTQSYPEVAIGTSTGANSVIGIDWKHLNPAFGQDWELQGQEIGSALTYTLQSGTTSVYKIAPLNGAVYSPYRQRIMGWSADKVLTEKSGVGVTLTDADAWKYSYARNAGEGFAGSSAGDLFAVIPKLETGINKCHASQVSYRTPCFFATSSMATQVIQMQLDSADPTGRRMRSVGYGGSRPGTQYVYSAVRPFGDSTKFWSTVQHHNGWFTGAVLIDPGQMPGDSVNRTTFIEIPLKAQGNIIAEFGYDENGARDAFLCTARADKCVANAATIDEAAPFNWVTATPASSTIKIPALSGSILYYRIKENGTWGGLQVLAVK